MVTGYGLDGIKGKNVKNHKNIRCMMYNKIIKKFHLKRFFLFNVEYIRLGTFVKGAFICIPYEQNLPY